jgi:hypothetical protein
MNRPQTVSAFLIGTLAKWTSIFVNQWPVDRSRFAV